LKRRTVSHNTSTGVAPDKRDRTPEVVGMALGLEVKTAAQHLPGAKSGGRHF